MLNTLTPPLLAAHSPHPFPDPASTTGRQAAALIQQACMCAQLAKAQAQLQRWQAAKAAGERKRLADEVEDECKSIAWQARVVSETCVTSAPCVADRRWCSVNTRNSSKPRAPGLMR